MKNSSVKGLFGVLAAAAVVLAVKKMAERKKAMKGIFREFGIREKSPFGFADRIREMDDEKYTAFKNSLQEKFGSACCTKFARKPEHADA